MDEQVPNWVEIPFEQLESETLYAVVESYALREGTDYGTQEVSIEAKVKQLLGQLRSKRIHLVFDPESESCTLISAEQFKKSSFSLEGGILGA